MQFGVAIPFSHSVSDEMLSALLRIAVERARTTFEKDVEAGRGAALNNVLQLREGTAVLSKPVINRSTVNVAHLLELAQLQRAAGIEARAAGFDDAAVAEALRGIDQDRWRAQVIFDATLEAAEIMLGLQDVSISVATTADIGRRFLEHVAQAGRVMQEPAANLDSAALPAIVRRLFALEESVLSSDIARGLWTAACIEDKPLSKAVIDFVKATTKVSEGAAMLLSLADAELVRRSTESRDALRAGELAESQRREKHEVDEDQRQELHNSNRARLKGAAERTQANVANWHARLHVLAKADRVSSETIDSRILRNAANYTTQSSSVAAKAAGVRFAPLDTSVFTRSEPVARIELGSPWDVWRSNYFIEALRDIFFTPPDIPSKFLRVESDGKGGNVQFSVLNTKKSFDLPLSELYRSRLGRLTTSAGWDLVDIKDPRRGEYVLQIPLSKHYFVNATVRYLVPITIVRNPAPDVHGTEGAALSGNPPAAGQTTAAGGSIAAGGAAASGDSSSFGGPPILGAGTSSPAPASTRIVAGSGITVFQADTELQALEGVASIVASATPQLQTVPSEYVRTQFNGLNAGAFAKKREAVDAEAAAARRAWEESQVFREATALMSKEGRCHEARVTATALLDDVKQAVSDGLAATPRPGGVAGQVNGNPDEALIKSASLANQVAIKGGDVVDAVKRMQAHAKAGSTAPVTRPQVWAYYGWATAAWPPLDKSWSLEMKEAALALTPLRAYVEAAGVAMRVVTARIGFIGASLRVGRARLAADMVQAQIDLKSVQDLLTSARASAGQPDDSADVETIAEGLRIERMQKLLTALVRRRREQLSRQATILALLPRISLTPMPGAASALPPPNTSALRCVAGANGSVVLEYEADDALRFGTLLEGDETVQEQDVLLFNETAQQLTMVFRVEHAPGSRDRVFEVSSSSANVLPGESVFVRVVARPQAGLVAGVASATLHASVVDVIGATKEVPLVLAVEALSVSVSVSGVKKCLACARNVLSHQNLTRSLPLRRPPE